MIAEREGNLRGAFGRSIVATQWLLIGSGSKLGESSEEESNSKRGERRLGN
jgi:hypothetical protein